MRLRGPRAPVREGIPGFDERFFPFEELWEGAWESVPNCEVFFQAFGAGLLESVPNCDRSHHSHLLSWASEEEQEDPEGHAIHASLGQGSPGKFLFCPGPIVPVPASMPPRPTRRRFSSRSSNAGLTLPGSFLDPVVSALKILTPARELVCSE